MSNEQQLGEIRQVDVRGVWEHEQYDFTPWLAGPENIALLGDAIGVELEVEDIEVAVGPYSADILAKDSDSRYVVIENQFGKTNHDHLGKLLTYASFLNAGVVVWIAEKFTDEHQKAVEWINDRTSEELSLFAVSLELWTIDGSRPAVRFNVLSRPHELVKLAIAKKQSSEITPIKQLQLEFWTAVRDRLQSTGVVKSPQTPRPQYWFDVPLGRTHIHLSNIANVQQGRIGVRVYINHRIAGWMLPTLEHKRDAIEKEIGSVLEWDPFPDKLDKIVVLHRDANLEDRNSWPDHVTWMVDQIGRFKRAFAGRIKLATEPMLEDDA